MIQMTETGPTIGLQHIESLGRRLGQAIPAGLARWLCAHNGGVPSPNEFPIRAHPFMPTDKIEVVFGINPSARHLDIEDTARRLAGRLPPKVLPLARCSCGAVLVTKLEGPETGQIFYWDPNADGEPMARLFFVATNIDSLMAGLKFSRPDTHAE
jgi:hypothetical protein